MNWHLFPRWQGVQRVGSNWQITAFNATGDTMGKQPQTETHISHVTYARCIIATWSARQYNQCL